MKKAVKMSANQRAAFNKFNETFTEETVEKWDKMVSTWDADIQAPNPYEEPAAGMLICNRTLACRAYHSYRYDSS